MKNMIYESFIENYGMLLSQTFYKFTELENSEKLDKFEKIFFKILKK